MSRAAATWRDTHTHTHTHFHTHTRTSGLGVRALAAELVRVYFTIPVHIKKVVHLAHVIVISFRAVFASVDAARLAAAPAPLGHDSSGCLRQPLHH